MSGDQPNALKPQVLWAQRNDCLYVTISLGDVKDKVLELKSDSLYFSGKSGIPKLVDYDVKLNLYGEVDVDASKQMSTDREIVMYIKKKELGFWPRLCTDIKKAPWLGIDFNRYVDENESDQEMGGGMGMDRDFSSMLSQMSNFNDYGGEDADVDSDDDDLPDLEPPTKAMGEEESNGKMEEKEDEAKPMMEPVATEASA